MSDWRLADLPEYAFPRMRALLKGIEPGAPVLNLSIGEPKHPFPDFIREVLASSVDGYSQYPPNDGTPELREAAWSWLQRRYGLPETLVDPHAQIVPVNGTREGLFNAGVVTIPESKNGKRPLVLMPNPFYQCYVASTLANGATPVFIPATRDNTFVPDFAGLSEDVLAQTAAIYLCAPANPQGSVVTKDSWVRLLIAAQTHDFVVIADECYAEIYDKEPPVGILEAALQIAKDQSSDEIFEHLLAFHSLSKRSNLPGLRSGFVTGGKKIMQRFRLLRAYGGAPSPLPLYAAATAAWNDDAHVAANRELYRAKIDFAESLFQDRLGFFRPPGGFFLWLDTSQAGLTGEEATVKLWREGGIQVLPGQYLSRDMGAGDPGLPPGAETPFNPGAAYIRVALVHDQETTEKALTAVNQILF